MRVVVPVLANDGRDATGVGVGVGVGHSVERFAVPGTAAVAVDPQQYPFRNGWAQLGTFDLPPGTTTATLVMTPTAE